MGLYEVPFVGFAKFRDNFIEFPNIGYLDLVETDVVYACKVLLSDLNV